MQSKIQTLMERSVGWVRKEKSRTAYQVLLEDSPMETAPTEELHEMKAVNAYSLYVVRNFHSSLTFMLITYIKVESRGRK